MKNLLQPYSSLCLIAFPWHIVLLLICIHSSLLSQSNPNFDYPIIVEKNEGYYNSHVIDKNGFLWMGGGGLQSFDGNHYKEYISDPQDSSSIRNAWIGNLFYDKEAHQIWISYFEKNASLGVLDIKTEKFKHYPFEKHFKGGNGTTAQVWTFKDNFGNLWMNNCGLLKYLPKIDTFQRITYQPLPSEPDLKPEDANRLVNYSLDVYNDSIVWLASMAGLLKFNVVTEDFFLYPLKVETAISNRLQSVMHHKDDRVYVSTWDSNGAFRFDVKTETFSRCDFPGYSASPKDSINTISDFLPKSEDRIWIASLAGLLEYDVIENQIIKVFPPNNFGEKHPSNLQYDLFGRLNVSTAESFFIFDPIFEKIKPYHIKLKKNHFNWVNKVVEDKKTGKLWIGTQIQEGLYRLNLNTEEIEVFLPPSSSLDKQSNFKIDDLYQAKNEDLLVLSKNQIFRFFDKQQKLIPLELEFKKSDWSINKIMEDAQGNIWAGGTELFKIEPAEKKIQSYNKQFTKSKNQKIRDLKEDRNGNIWILSSHLSVYDSKRDSFHIFPNLSADGKKLYNYRQLAIDGNGDVLISAFEKGILFTDAEHPESGVVDSLARTQGLKGNPFFLFLGNDKNILSISNKQALEKITPDRISSDEFLVPGYLKGNMYFASQLSNGNIVMGLEKKGILIFNPDSLIANKKTITPYVSSFKVFDKEIKKELSLFYPQDIYLKPGENFFSLELSVLNPSFIGEFDYTYQLEGIDPEWVTPENRNYVAYTNIESGNYTFKLKANTNNSTLSNKTYELKIHIATPWYKTWWAYALWTSLVLGTIYLLYKIQLSRKLSEQEAHRLKELDTFKTRFYSNITHEFRTPLTVIQGMADELEKYPAKEPEIKLGLIKKNSHRLLALVNQMLELSKLKAGKGKLDLQQDDVILFVKYLVEAHESFAKIKNVGLQFYSEEKELLMDFDAKKLEDILTNLISNAIKFTPEYGKILVVAKTNNTNLEIEIKDSGIGISADQLPFIFDRFHQANPIHEDQGSGIGLALVKELMSIMNGKIKVKSEPNIGTTFFLNFPIQNNAPLISSTKQLHFDKKGISTIPKEMEEDVVENGLPILLIIEDNADVVFYLQKCLENEYQILVARNGKLGVKKAIEVLPDIIISDVMMPEMDGFEVCATLKQDERTNHIPIILLTAKATSEDKLAGLTHGADAYLIKPFEKEELLVRLNNLMQIRKTLQKKYSSTLISEQIQEEQIIETKESLFIKKLEQIVIEHLEEEDFSVNELAQELLLSRSQTHRKIKALTGVSTAIYIRHIRLQKAKILLTSTELSISEIAYQVGFKSPVYFSQIFKETFDESPSDFRK